jgi:hypothetical protein
LRRSRELSTNPEGIEVIRKFAKGDRDA